MAAPKKKPRIGDVVQISLPTGQYAYGRVYRDATIGVYATKSSSPGTPPAGSRDFSFFVGIYDDALRSCPIVGRDSFSEDESGWPPPRYVKDALTGAYRLYHKGVMRPSTAAECTGLEPAAVWELQHIVDRLMGRFDWKSLR